MSCERRATVVVVGGGHSGLAMSKRLSDRAVDHVVLERGEVANSWRTQRWDSFTLLTPNWQTELPGRAYDGDDPDESDDGDHDRCGADQRARDRLIGEEVHRPVRQRVSYSGV